MCQIIKDKRKTQDTKNVYIRSRNLHYTGKFFKTAGP